MSEFAQEHRLSLREERAEVTRRRISDAAQALFARDGYGATPLRKIAAEAGVAVQTVYAVFGSKSGILEGLLARVVHDPEAERLFADAMSEPRAEERLALFARSIRLRWEHGASIIIIHRDAALTDPGVRAGVERVLERRRAGLRSLTDALEPDLARGLDPVRAAAILDALTLPELWSELLDIHGWSADEYERWLSALLTRQLLADTRKSWDETPSTR